MPGQHDKPKDSGQQSPEEMKAFMKQWVLASAAQGR